MGPALAYPQKWGLTPRPPTPPQARGKLGDLDVSNFLCDDSIYGNNFRLQWRSVFWLTMRLRGRAESWGKPAGLSLVTSPTTSALFLITTCSQSQPHTSTTWKHWKGKVFFFELRFHPAYCAKHHLCCKLKSCRLTLNVCLIHLFGRLALHASLPFVLALDFSRTTSGRQYMRACRYFIAYNFLSCLFDLLMVWCTSCISFLLFCP